MCALLSCHAFAQGTGVITGVVTDAATNTPLADVSVTATSPALQAERVVVTDGSGTYRLSQLPPGVYTLKLEKGGFKPAARDELTVRSDRTRRANLQLQAEAQQDDPAPVVVKVPTVDVGTASTGVLVNTDFVETVPFIQPNANGMRSFEQLASVAPQVVQDPFGFGFNGAQSPENLYRVDGVSVSDPTFGTNGAQLPVEFVKEVDVATGALMAEYGRTTGGVLDVVTRSGSNEFHGAVWGTWTPGALSAHPTLVDRDATAVTTQRRLLNTGDFGVRLGGPIVKDRLWFFVGYAPSFTATDERRSLRAVVRDPVTGLVDDRPELPGSAQSRTDGHRAHPYIAKLTLLLTPDDTLSLSVSGAQTSGNNPGAFDELRRSANGWGGGMDTTDHHNTLSLRYQGAFLDKHLLVDAVAGWFHRSRSTLPDDGSGFADLDQRNGTAAATPMVTFRRGVPRPITDFEQLTAEGAALCVDPSTGMSSGALCPATGRGATYAIGGPGLLQQLTMDRVQGRASATVLFQALGHHVAKAGVDFEHLRSDVTTGWSGGVVMRESASGEQFTAARRFEYAAASDEALIKPFTRSNPTGNNVGAWVQDSWALMDLITLNVGLRYEHQQLFKPDGTLGLTLNDLLSPRLGVVYDFTQQGRSKLFAHYARYHQSVPLELAHRALSGQGQVLTTHARGGTPGCDPLSDLDQVLGQCQDPGNDVGVPASYTPSRTGALAVGRNLKAQSSDELVVGGEYEVVPDGRFGVTYTHRYMNSVLEDVAVGEGSSLFLGNPGEGEAAALPRAQRTYHAVTASFSKAFSDGWLAQASYTYSTLSGNYNGLFRPETGQLSPNATTDFDVLSLQANTLGPLAADHHHWLRAYASKEFVISNSFSLLAGLTYEGRSGAPINYLGSHPVLGADEVLVLPRGSGGRLPWRHVINAKVAGRYRITRDNVVELSVDVFNLFNFQAVTAVDQSLTASDVVPFRTEEKDPQAAACLAGSALPQCSGGNTAIDTPTQGPNGEPVKLTRGELNSDFKQPTAYQAPISVRFGLRFSF